jgi:GTP-binding protein
LRVVATRFIRSAARPADFPSDGRPEIALVGRSNVGKSSLINALVGQEVARTSAAPGKTRLVNLYRVEMERGAGPWYLADLPGYGHAGGGEDAARGFDRLTGDYFREQGSGIGNQGLGAGGRARTRRIAGIILAVDARHPGLARDVAAFEWLAAQAVPIVVVATKIDKLSQAERAHLGRRMETSFGVAAVPVSAATGEGLEQLWKHLQTWIRHQ